MPDDSSARIVLLNHLADEFAERYRRGERPALKSYIDRHPELADEIREFFPAMVEVEQVVEDRAEVTRPPAFGPLPILERLGDYRIIREIGRGGMGVVYEAEQVSLGRHVALKVLPKQLLLDARTKERFEREARAAARLHHTNIVPVFVVGEYEGLPYYVMQFIQGLGLDEVLEELQRLQSGAKNSGGEPRLSNGELRVFRRDAAAAVARQEVTAANVAQSLLTGRFELAEDVESTVAGPADPSPDATLAASPPVCDQGDLAASPVPGRLSDSFSLSSSSVVLPGASFGGPSGRKRLTYWRSVARIGVQVSDALHHAHGQGVLHRDIKPSNLLLDTAGVVWVADFGLAKAEDQKNLTDSGDILGTLRYMPPEAFEGRSDARADVYSLGLTLYELLSLRPAFDEKERHRLIKRVTTGEPNRLDKLNPEVPPDLVTIVHKAIERDPDHRYPSAGELTADLQRFLDDEPILARRQTQRERYWRWARRHPGIAILGGALTAVLVAATVVSLLVAARMTTLANREARAAADERTARADADRARERETQERASADAAKRAAQASQGRAMDALQKAEENFAKARAAVNDYLTAVSDDPRLQAPGLSPLRASLLQSALGFYQQFLKERGTDPTLRRELAAVYFKVGTIMADLGQRESAQQSIDQSRRSYEALAVDRPDDPEILSGLAKALCRQGKYEQAIAIGEKLVRPDDPRYQADLAEAYNGLAITAATDDKAKQLEFQRKSLLVRERLVQLRPDDPDAHLGLSASLNNVALQLIDDRNLEKLALVRRAVEHCEAAYRIRPTDSISCRFLATQLENLASFAHNAGEIEEALASHRRKVEVLDRRARDNPMVPGLETNLLEGYCLLLRALQEAGRLEEAVRVAEAARARMAEASEETIEFKRMVSWFRLIALSSTLALAKAAPDRESTTARDGADAVSALREHTLAGWHDPNWVRSDPLTEPLRDREDFKELLAQMDVLAQSDARARHASAKPEDRLAGRRSILKTLEALARPLPPARFIRRRLAQARQDLAQALLDAGRFEDARAAFVEAHAERQKLFDEAPTNESLQADLIQSQVSNGNLLASAGRLKDAVTAWEQALAALEASLRANPNSLRLTAALSARLCDVGQQYLWAALWSDGLRCYRRAFDLRAPSRFVQWVPYALLLAETGDKIALEELITRALSESPNWDDIEDAVAYSQLVLLAPCSDARWYRTVKAIAEDPRHLAWDGWDRWIRAVARIRVGQAKEGLDRLATFEDPYWKWPAVAIAENQLGHAALARAALGQADLEADRVMEINDSARPVTAGKRDWLFFRAFRREAHRCVNAGRLPDSPYERLFRGRVLFALGKADEAVAELAAAVALRPDDVEVWLARARIYAKIGRNEQMVDDRLKAQQLKGDDPKTWIEIGRMLIELGDHKQADAAFARASSMGNGSLSRFLESGWWLVGPYPAKLDLACPPEIHPDPSKPVAAVGGQGDLRWQPVPFVGRSQSGPAIGQVIGDTKNASYYILDHAFADHKRTATLHFMVWNTDDARVWVNDQLVFDGARAWKQPKWGEHWIPISLEAGRNTVLVKVSHSEGYARCLIRFHDHPVEQANQRMRLGAWAEAARVLETADRSAPLDVWWYEKWLWCLAASRPDEYRRLFTELVRRHNRPGNDLYVAELASSCLLPPAKTDEREGWVASMAERAAKAPRETWRQYWLGNAYLRAGRFQEAEKSLRKAIETYDHELYQWPLLATTLHYLGRAKDARATLQKTEERYSKLRAGAIAENPPVLPQWWEEELIYQATIHEARSLILGPADATGPDVRAVLAWSSERLSEIEAIEDDFARLVRLEPGEPRLWVDWGRRQAALGRWDNARQSFAKAIALAPLEPQVWKEVGRAQAEILKWDEAAMSLSRVLELTPAPQRDFPYYPWQFGRGAVDDLIAGSDELFDRVSKARPKDLTLSARRAEHFAETGRWGLAETALRKHLERFPEDWWAPNLLAKMLLYQGRTDDFDRVCRETIDRFKGRTEFYLPINIARSAMLVPTKLADHAMVQRIIADADRPESTEYWLQVTAAVAELRRGNAAAALKRLDLRVTPVPDYPNSQAFADLVRALANFKTGRTAEAQLAFGRAQGAIERARQRPDNGPKAWDWHNWTQVMILAREAGRLIPTAPAESARESLAREQAVARERKARSDRVSARAAIALIRLDIGQRKEAETELKEVVAERASIAAEEPANGDFLAALAETHEQLSRLYLTPETSEIVPTAEHQETVWRYTFEKPAENWTQPGFDDSRWSEGPGGFGTSVGPVKTTWNTPDLWLRRKVTLPSSTQPARLRLRVVHDDDFDIAMNGANAATVPGYNGNYHEVAIEAGALALVKPGAGVVLAAHCHNVGGTQGVDIGLIGLKEVEPEKLEEATREISLASAVVARIDSANPKRERMRQHLACTCVDIAETAEEQGRRPEIVRAIEIAAGLVDTAPAADSAGSGAIGWLIRTVVHGWRQDTDQARKASRMAAKLLKPAPGDAALIRLVRRGVRAVGLESPEAADLLAAWSGEPPVALTEAIRGNPENAQVYRERADWYGSHGLWDRAAADLGEAIRREPDSKSELKLGIVLAHFGKLEQYRQLCRTMVGHWSKSTNIFDADATSKTCLLRGDSKVNPDGLIKLIQVGTSSDPNQPFVEWFNFCKGMHAYRTGKWVDALASCGEARRRVDVNTTCLKASCLAVESMAHFRLRGAGDAKSLAEAKALLNDHFPIIDDAGSWFDWLAAYVLTREAEALIDGPKDGMKQK